MADPHIKNDLLIALGELTAEFSALEGWLNISLETLTNPEDDKVGEIVAAEMSVRAKIDLIMALFRYREKDPDKVSEMKHILKLIGNVNGRRNDLIHSVWVMNDTETWVSRSTAKFETGFVSEIYEQFPIKKIREVTNDIKVRRAMFYDFFSNWTIENNKQSNRT